MERLVLYSVRHSEHRELLVRLRVSRNPTLFVHLVEVFRMLTQDSRNSKHGSSVSVSPCEAQRAPQPHDIVHGTRLL